LASIAAAGSFPDNARQGSSYPAVVRHPQRCGWIERDGVWMQGIFGSSGQLLLPLVFFALLYFLMIAPNQKKQKKWQQMLSQLKSGDKVTTNGGIRGVIVSVKDDVVQLRIAPDNVKLEFVKNAIATVTTAEE
jgi:preprotein translocase subunit YajC